MKKEFRTSDGKRFEEVTPIKGMDGVAINRTTKPSGDKPLKGTKGYISREILEPIRKRDGTNASDVDIWLGIYETKQNGTKYDFATSQIADYVYEFVQRGETRKDINDWLLKCYNIGSN